jgi:hypothetical protein
MPAFENPKIISFFQLKLEKLIEMCLFLVPFLLGPTSLFFSGGCLKSETERFSDACEVNFGTRGFSGARMLRLWQ